MTGEEWDDRLRDVYLSGQGGSFTVDHVTDNGRLTVAGNHDPNGAQNGIGALFGRWRAQGWIEPTGTYVKSTTPHGRGRTIAVWRFTTAGEAWATRSDVLF